MNDVEKNLIESIRACVFKTGMVGDGIPDVPKKVLKLAQSHAVLPTIMPDYEAVSKSDNQLFAADEMQSYFEQHGIYNCALKGINTKRRYPKPGLRPMSDLDVLYKPNQHNELVRALNQLGYTYENKGQKHDFFKRLPFIFVEAHRDLVAADSSYYEYYKDFWDKLVLKPNCKYTYEMKLEDEFIYCIVHAAEHMKLGGIGIRPVLDFAVYLSSARGLRHRFSGGADAQSASEGELENRRDEEFNWEYFYDELDKLGLRTFYNKISAIAEKWFLSPQPSSLEEGGSAEPDRVLEDFVLESGLYGTEENANAAWVKGNKEKFIASAIFPPYESMCSLFPWLRGKKILLPIAWIIKIIRAILFKRKNVKAQFSRYKNYDNNQYKKVERILKELELS